MASCAEKVVVFGGAGFLGSHVCDALSQQGYDVHIFDLSPSSFSTSEQTMITGNILDKEAVLAACQGATYIYNFAGRADINEAHDTPLRTAELNITGHLHILEAARQVQAKRLIFASTVYVCGESGSFYCASKQASERFTELYQERYGLDFSILRYGSLYGPRADKRNTIYNFVNSALNEKKISYTGTGQEIREYIHVVDAAQASTEILDEKYKNATLVLTGHHAFRVKDVMTMITEILGDSHIELVFRNDNLGAHYNITPYAFRPRDGKKLVVSPFVDMGQGIIDCIQDQTPQTGLFIPQPGPLKSQQPTS